MNVWEHFLLLHSVTRYGNMVRHVSDLKEAAQLVTRNYYKQKKCNNCA